MGLKRLQLDEMGGGVLKEEGLILGIVESILPNTTHPIPPPPTPPLTSHLTLLICGLSHLLTDRLPTLGPPAGVTSGKL